MDGIRCRNCGKATLVPGHLAVAEGSPIYGFAPAATRAHVRLRVAFNACTSCGHLWASVAPEELQSAIEIHGTELIKQHLVSAQSGRYRDLPDIPEAIQAADGVAEIDSLVLAGNGLEAARRFRHLTGTIWDEVHAIVSGWANLTRTRKLALFGWRPKGTPDDADDREQRSHPMHDRLLDG